MLAQVLKIDLFGEHLAKLLIPHHRNNHHPWLIRHEALFGISALMIFSQLVSNLQVNRFDVLGYGTSIYQNEIVSLTNQERIKNGSPGLKESSLLNQAAAKKAAHMFSKNYWAHYAPDGTSPWYFFNLVGYKYSWAGENLARDFQTSQGVVQGWMNSPSHKTNLLNSSYTEIGVAVVNGTLQGEETTLVVQLFGTPSSSGAVAQSSPAPAAGNPKSVSDQLVLEKSQKTVSPASAAAAPVTKISNSFSGGFNLFQRVQDLPTIAKFELFLLLSVFLVFLVDSVVLFRKGIQRPGSHSFAHAIVIVILVVSILANFKGKLI